jgi:hypothetical protein
MAKAKPGDREKPWQKSSANFVVVDAILAAVTVFVMQMLEHETKCATWFVFGALAIFLFILDAEQMSNALQEDNLNKYLRYQIAYNVAVLLLLLDLAKVLDHYLHWHVGVPLVAVTLLWAPWWGCDTLFLVSGRLGYEPQYDEWKAMLQGGSKVKVKGPCRRAWTCLFRRCDPSKQDKGKEAVPE